MATPTGQAEGAEAAAARSTLELELYREEEGDIEEDASSREGGGARGALDGGCGAGEGVGGRRRAGAEGHAAHGGQRGAGSA